MYKHGPAMSGVNAKNLNPTLNKFYAFTRLNSLAVNVAGHPLDGLPLSLLKEGSFINYETNELPLTKNYLIENLKFKDEVRFKSVIGELYCGRDLITLRPSYIEPSNVKVRGQIHQLSTTNNHIGYEDKYFRLLVPIDQMSHTSILECFDFTHKIYHKKKYNILEFNAISNQFNIIILNDNGFYFLIIDSLQKTSIELFANLSYMIQVALGFFSGDLQLDEGYCFTYDNIELAHPKNFQYLKLIPSISTGTPVITKKPFDFNKQIINQEEDYLFEQKMLSTREIHHWYVKEIYFSKFCTMLYNNNNLILSITSFLYAHNEDPEIAIRDYFIILETLSNIYVDDKILTKPIKDLKIASKLIKKLLITIEETIEDKDISEEGKNILKKKILNINNPVNQDNLIRLFTKFGYELNENELSAVKKKKRVLAW